MAATAVPPALRTRLGIEASDELIEWMHSREQTMMSACADGFQLALTSEAAAIRTETHGVRAALGVEIAQLESRLRTEMQDGFGGLHGLIATKQAELMKWAFVFWVGQAMWTVGMVVAALGVIAR